MGLAQFRFEIPEDRQPSRIEIPMSPISLLQAMPARQQAHGPIDAARPDNPKVVTDKTIASVETHMGVPPDRCRCRPHPFRMTATMPIGHLNERPVPPSDAHEKRILCPEIARTQLLAATYGDGVDDATMLEPVQKPAKVIDTLTVDDDFENDFGRQGRYQDCDRLSDVPGWTGRTPCRAA